MQIPATGVGWGSASASHLGSCWLEALSPSTLTPLIVGLSSLMNGLDLAELLSHPPQGRLSCGKEEGWTAERSGGDTGEGGEGGGERRRAVACTLSNLRHLAEQPSLEDVI